MLRRVFILVLAAVGLVAAPYASAQIKGFAGGGLGFNTIAADSVFVSPGNPDFKDTTGKSNLTGQIEGGVRFDAGNMVFGVGLYLNPLTLKADEVSDPPFSQKTEVKNLKGLFGEVGFKLASATVAYGRLSFSQATVEAKLTDPTNVPSSLSVSKTFTGVGVGAGIRHALANKMYLFADWHHTMGSEVSLDTSAITGAGDTLKIKPTLTTGLVGAGWTFP